MYRRRIMTVLVIMFLVFCGLLGRLAVLQLVHGDDSRREFEDSLSRKSFPPAKRGMILDRKGKILAMDEACYAFCLDYRLLSNNTKWLGRQTLAIQRKEKVSKQEARRRCEQRVQKAWDLAVKACGSRQECDAAVARIVRRVEALTKAIGDTPKEAEEFHALAGELDEKTAVALRAQIYENTIGAAVRPANRRWYPSGLDAGHVIGLTGAISDEQFHKVNAAFADMDEPDKDRSRYELADTIGLFGVERMCENVLRGTRGYTRLSRDPNTSQVLPPRHGLDVTLTLDIELQRQLYDYFRQTYPSHNGCIVLLDIKTGGVLAMVNIPGFDLNRYKADFPKLSKDDYDFPLMNRAIARTYEPGSTVKPVLALAGMMAGAIRPGDAFLCDGRLFPDKSYFTCTGTHGTMTVSQAITHSCNEFFYHLAMRMEARRRGSVEQWYRRFGFAEPMGTHLLGERRGRLHVKEKYDEVRVSIGQEPLMLTPLQVANAMAIVARGGRTISPTVVARTSGKDPQAGLPRQVRGDLKLSPSAVQVVQRAMHNVTLSGTAATPYAEAGLDFEVCAKSGSAQTADQWTRDSDGNKKVLRSGWMAWLSGYAPYRNPQVAFAVVVEYVDYDLEGGGARMAAPIAFKAMQMCKDRGYLK